MRAFFFAYFSGFFDHLNWKSHFLVKIRVRKSPLISPSSNGFPEKPIRISDRTEHFFAPKSRFWQCVKSTGYAELHPKSCRQMPGWNQNCRFGKNISEIDFARLVFCRLSITARKRWRLKISLRFMCDLSASTLSRTATGVSGSWSCSRNVSNTISCRLLLRTA